MTDAVETIAWVSTPPWHGKGFQVAGNLTPAEMMVAAQVDWTVSKRPIKYRRADGKTATTEEHFVLARDTDDRVLDVVGPRYVPVQNADAFQFMAEVAEAADISMEVAGSLRNGQLVWGLAKINAGFSLPGKDRIEPYLLVGCPHQQGKAWMTQLTDVRVVCQNTFSQALRGSAASRITFRHVKEFTQVERKRVREAMGIVREQIDEHRDNIVKLTKITMSHDDGADFLFNLFDGEDPTKPNKVAQQAMTALDHAPGYNLASAKGTAWGVLNAATYTLDHLWRKDEDRRLYQSWFGTNASIKRRAFSSLLAA